MLLLKSQKFWDVIFLNFYSFLETRIFGWGKTTAPVKTASQLQVKKGIYRGSSQVWKNFEPFIGEAFEPLID
ncbi:MAG: hypothetical protein CM15mP85_21340 [Rhodobacterales bacterium]|nr:MAG: hypothetical protein CM15mP85_21340 [Rhodobacterales bacterium]